jgi:Rv2525c-like, glycoside hydrolase-like domain
MFQSARLHFLSIVSLSVAVGALSIASQAQITYLGFDRNDYPGDENLPILRRTFSYAGYWLNNPPGAKNNTWAGKRPALESAGFGFLVLFNGRLYKELKHNAAAISEADGRAAANAARREGFPPRTIIFLDIEEGGRMLPEQKAYIYAWVDAVSAGGFEAGVYCSGIPAREGKGSIVTAEDIRANAQGRDISFWVTNDACPPSPGCAVSPSAPSQSGVAFADVWQFAQSPRRKDFAAQCHNYSSDGNCYPPGVDAASHLHVDVNTATSADPSHGKNH